jgi:hypothetical protein
MGAPQTLPADFQGWDKAPTTLPADFNKWDQPKEQQASGVERFGSGVLSGAGVVSNEQGKNFFRHPLDTLKQMAQGQGELAVRAKNELANKDYVRGLTHAVEYLMPGLGPTLARAGDQLNSGDYAGGAGTTVGAAIPIIAGAPEGRAAVGSAAAKTVQAGRIAGQVLKDTATPENIGTAVGGIAGAKIGSLLGEPLGGGAAGAAFGRTVGKSVAKRMMATPEVATVEAAPGSAGSMAESVAKPPVKPAVVEQQLKQALGAQDLKPGVPLKDQLRGANAQPKPQLPEGFTPVESTAMKGFKYDPATREFETITQGGQRYVHGDVSPEDAQAFMDADSKGKAWQQIRENPLVAKVINGKRIATKPTASAEAAPTDDLMPKLQESLKQAQAAKASAAPKFVYRARDVGESGVPVNNDLAQATSDPFQALKYAEAGQRGAKAGEVVKIDLSKLKPSDYVVKTHPSGAKWIQFTRPLTEDEVSAFTGKAASKK